MWTAALLVTVAGISSLVSGSDQLLPPATVQCPAAAEAAAHTKSQYYPGTFITDITPHCPAWLPSQWPAHPHHGTIIVIIGNRNKEHPVNILVRVASLKVGSMSFPPRIQSEKCYVGSRSLVACCQKKSETVMVMNIPFNSLRGFRLNLNLNKTPSGKS